MYVLKVDSACGVIVHAKRFTIDLPVWGHHRVANAPHCTGPLLGEIELVLGLIYYNQIAGREPCGVSNLDPKTVFLHSSKDVV